MSKPSTAWRRSGIAGLATATLLGASVLTAGAASADADFEFERAAGKNRYATSADIAERFGDSTEVILASGEDGHFPDALVGNFLAGEVEAPILLTRFDRTPQVVLDAIEEVGATTIHLVGGPLAISEGQEAALSEDYTVNRIGDANDNRYETGAKVLAEGDAANASNTALIATGENFPDALAAGPVSYAGRHPLGIVKTNDVPQPVLDALKAAGVDNALVVGGEMAVGPEVVAELEANEITVAERIDDSDFGGTGRDATAAALAEYAVAELGFTDEAANVATGEPELDGADALAGGPLAGSQGPRPILITQTTNNPGSTTDYLRENACTLSEGIIYGGFLAVSQSAEDQMEEAARDCPGNQAFASDPATDETAGDRAGDNQTVTFSGIESETVDLRLTNCDQVTVGQDGTVTFNDDDGTPNQADLDGATSGSILSVDGVAGGYGDSANNVVVGDDGSVTVELSRDAAGCARLVAFDGATNNVLDLDANNEPTEDFAVSGRILTTDPDGVDASPETATNPYGEAHTVTAQLTDGEADVNDATTSNPSAEAGVAVRFSRYADTCTGTPIEVVNTVTDADGQAEYTFNATDPNSAAGDTSEFCVRVQADINGNGIGLGDPVDDVQKTYSDAAPEATTVSLTPESDVNLVGSQHTVTATVTDQYGNPVAGQAVDFAVDTDEATTFDPTSVEFSGTRTTNANGVATFTYTGPEDTAAPNNRDDIIRATADENDATPGDDPRDEASKEWSEGVATIEGDTDAEDQKFGTLQEAINAGDAGDTITAEGEFTEDVLVNEEVTLNGGGSDLTGQFDVAADNVTIDGFDIRSNERGIEVQAGGFEDLTFTDNTIAAPTAGSLITGIYLNPGGAVTISGNTITGATAAIGTDTDGVISITGNTLTNNEEGIGVSGANFTISGNTFTTNNDDNNDVYVQAYGVNLSNAYLDAVVANNSFNPAAEVDYTTDTIEPVDTP